MASVLAGSGEASIACPRNTILVQENLHYSLLRVTPAASSFCNTVLYVGDYHVLLCFCRSQGYRQHGIPHLVVHGVSHSCITENVQVRL